jgi:hypothetical protein
MVATNLETAPEVMEAVVEWQELVRRSWTSLEDLHMGQRLVVRRCWQEEADPEK